jgi:hypothetical protein
MKCLRKLNLDNNKFGDLGMRFLSQLDNLEELSIDNLSCIQQNKHGAIGPVGAGFLSRLRNIHKLNLSNY